MIGTLAYTRTPCCVTPLVQLVPGHKVGWLVLLLLILLASVGVLRNTPGLHNIKNGKLKRGKASGTRFLTGLHLAAQQDTLAGENRRQQLQVVLNAGALQGYHRKRGVGRYTEAHLRG